jgi:hypothetical protein
VQTNFTDQEDAKKYHAARHVWNKRKQMTTSGKQTWSAWFERMFDEPLHEYAQRMAERKEGENE